jgi:hypothetical protein
MVRGGGVLSGKSLRILRVNATTVSNRHNGELYCIGNQVRKFKAPPSVSSQAVGAITVSD